MTIKFEITGVPPTTEDIQSEIKKKGLLGLLAGYLFIYIILLIIGFFISKVFGQVQTIPAWWIITFIMGFMIIMSIGTSEYKTNKHQLSDIDLDSCEEAVALIQSCAIEYPEVEAYWLAAIKQRHLTNGDLEAMERFVQEQKQSISTAKKQAAFDALHNPNSSPARTENGCNHGTE